MTDANAKIAELVDEWRQRVRQPRMPRSRSPATAAAALQVRRHRRPATKFPTTSIASRSSTPTIRSTAKPHADKYYRWLNGDPCASAHRHLLRRPRNHAQRQESRRPDTGGTFRGAPAGCASALGKLLSAHRVGAAAVRRVHGPRRPHPLLRPSESREQDSAHGAGRRNERPGCTSQTLGTPQEGKWGTFGGPRAYTNGCSPSRRRVPLPRHTPKQLSSQQKNRSRPRFRNRSCRRDQRSAIGGKAFVKSVEDLTLAEREAAIFREITSGNFPDFLRNFQTRADPRRMRAMAKKSRHAGGDARLSRRRQRR